MNPVFLRLVSPNLLPTYYEIPYVSNFDGIIEKKFHLSKEHCHVFLDCIQDNIIDKYIFKFYDIPPYQESKELEEEFNNILSKIMIVYNKELTSMEEIKYDNKHLNKNTLNENTLNEDSSRKVLVLSIELI
jgi:hypothetical protein